MSKQTFACLAPAHGFMNEKILITQRTHTQDKEETRQRRKEKKKKHCMYVAQTYVKHTTISTLSVATLITGVWIQNFVDRRIQHRALDARPVFAQFWRTFLEKTSASGESRDEKRIKQTQPNQNTNATTKPTKRTLSPVVVFFFQFLIFLIGFSAHDERKTH